MARNQYEAFLAEHGYRLYRPHRTLVDRRAIQRERRTIRRALRGAARLMSLIGWGYKIR
jgi:hypothetical protein